MVEDGKFFISAPRIVDGRVVVEDDSSSITRKRFFESGGWILLK